MTNPATDAADPEADEPSGQHGERGRSFVGIAHWLEAIDPGTHRRIKGLRLVTAYAIAAMLGALPAIKAGLTDGSSLSAMAGGVALWASVSEGRSNRADSARDLMALCAAAGLGAAILILFSSLVDTPGRPGAESILITGAFAVGYLKRFGILGAGIGSQIYIGQLLAYSSGLTSADLPMILLATLIASVASAVPRILSGPAEHPILPSPPSPALGPFGTPPELVMGVQAALAATVIVALGHYVKLEESAWAITACTYVIANSTASTMERVWRRIAGTVVGVPLAIAFLPLTADAPVIVWGAAALAMIIYAMALPSRYDIACGAYAFTLVVTLAVSGEHSMPLFLSRIWETVIGGGLGLSIALFLLPLREPPASGQT